jgi:hypothetical protein
MYEYEALIECSEKGKCKYSEKKLVPVSLYPQTGLGSNLGLCDEWPANDSLSHGTTWKLSMSWTLSASFLA